jgi:hypothetical protein
MRTHRGFMPRLRQPDEPSHDHVPGTTRSMNSDRVRSAARGLISGCATIIALSSCAMMGPTVVAEPGVAFLLPMGGVAAINGNGTRIKFDHVRNDGRCPADEACAALDDRHDSGFYSSRASVLVIISKNGSPSETRILDIAPPRNETTWDGLRIRLEDLTPEPRRSNGYTPGHYLAQLVVDRK